MAKKAKAKIKETNKLADDLQTFLKKSGAARLTRLGDELDNTQFISTGIKQLDYVIANQMNGGIAKVALLLGEHGAGKSLIAQKACAECQKMGGIAYYLDTENALNPKFANHLGLDINNLLMDRPEHVEQAFERIEQVIDFCTAHDPNKPILIAWDSVESTPAKAEVMAEYEDNHMAVKARALSSGFRKIMNKLADSNVTLLMVNQLRTDLGVQYGDNTISSGGKAMMYYPSIIIKLTLANQQYEGSGEKKEGISVDVNARVVKNRFGPPHRKAQFTVHYIKGPQEHEQILRRLNSHDGHFDVEFEGRPAKFAVINSSWKSAWVYDPEVNPEGDRNGDLLKIYKTQSKEDFYNDVINSEEWAPYVDAALEAVFVKTYEEIEEEFVNSTEGGFDPDSALDARVLASELEETIENMDADDEDE